MAGPDIVEMLRHHWDGQRNTEYACCTSIGDAAAETIAALRVALDEARAISDRDARDIAALRARVAEAERQLRALVFNTHTPHDLAKAKEDAIRWLTPSAPDVHTPKPVCKQCGRSLDARGKCRVPEHNP
ncbi:MAG: hypothetical protein H6826_13595 [Planctomycetes bacterium]|nr:hypothetical protein [Planctomycetota bacterium]